MKAFQKAVLLVGAAMLAALLWKIDAPAVLRMVLAVGWGMAVIVPQEAAAHYLNALGWRLSFPPDQARSFSVWELFKLRVCGDGINYLTPTATIAGEITRMTMLNDSHSTEARAASVVIAKFSQALAQALFVLAGFFFVAGARLPIPEAWRARMPWLGGFLLAVPAAFSAYALWGRHLISAPRGLDPDGPTRGTPAGTRPPGAVGAGKAAATVSAMAPTGLWRSVPGHLRLYLRNHPWRLAVSILFFGAAYAWGTFEAYWICRLLGSPVGVGMALTIEVLSIGIDGVLFMVPAKVGTQEGGKTAIFTLLGLAPSAGLAFGIVRHIRELVWAGAGFLIYSAHLSPSPFPKGEETTAGFSASS